VSSWRIPPGKSAEFVCRMEAVLDVYKRPYDPRFPGVCMDEMPKQLLGETEAPIPAAPGRTKRIEYEYVRQGTCSVWMFVEPLGGWRSVRATERRTRVDWANQVRDLVDDPRFAQAERITLVQDNLNTHDPSSLYEAFPPEEARRLARKLEFVYTPKKGSWLNVAEIELSVLDRQSTHPRIPALERVVELTKAWCDRRNNAQTKVDWQFTTEDARIKLK
jgi:DDE superfamily endonuclease